MILETDPGIRVVAEAGDGGLRRVDHDVEVIRPGHGGEYIAVTRQDGMP